MEELTSRGLSLIDSRYTELTHNFIIIITYYVSYLDELVVVVWDDYG